MNIKITKYAFVIGVFMLCRSYAAVNGDAPYLALEEHETVDFKAQVAAASSSYEDIKKLAEEGVSVSYNSYKPTYARNIDNEMNRLRGYDAISSAPYKLALLTQTEAFANAIINQIKVSAIRLSHQDKQVFWDVAGEQIQAQMLDFLISKSPYKAEFIMDTLHDLRVYIDNSINLQKQF